VRELKDGQGQEVGEKAKSRGKILGYFRCGKFVIYQQVVMSPFYVLGLRTAVFRHSLWKMFCFFPVCCCVEKSWNCSLWDVAYESNQIASENERSEINKK